ncbi:MAG: hypothetical protein JWQ48_86 [Conexibacter sp.]|nr:hypothetical protein [Conexibacter sp.]
MSAYERMPVAAPPREVVAAVRQAIKARGMYEYAVVDHGHDMRDAGAPGFEAWTLIFGNPAAGARLLARDLAAAVDIPLRLAVVRGSHGGSDIILRATRTLIGEQHPVEADAFDGALRALAARAREIATASAAG